MTGAFTDLSIEFKLQLVISILKSFQKTLFRTHFFKKRTSNRDLIPI